ncbi:MAG: hypothetical protein RLY43_1356 [Bacteroidota bacterium]|jgi:hypothetical protein
MNYLEIIQKVAVLYGTSKPTDFTESSLSIYDDLRYNINDSLKEIFYNEGLKLREASVNINTVIGQQSYTWDETYGRIRENGVFIAGETFPLVYTEDFSFFTGSSSDTGTPEYYGIYSGDILLYPKPDTIKALTIKYDSNNAAITVGGVAKSEMTLETDLPNFNAKYHDLVVYSALTYLCKDDQANYAIYEKRLKALLQMARKELSGSGDNVPMINIGSDRPSKLAIANYNLDRAGRS